MAVGMTHRRGRLFVECCSGYLLLHTREGLGGGGGRIGWGVLAWYISVSYTHYGNTPPLLTRLFRFLLFDCLLPYLFT